MEIIVENASDSVFVIAEMMGFESSEDWRYWRSFGLFSSFHFYFDGTNQRYLFQTTDSPVYLDSDIVTELEAIAIMKQISCEQGNTIGE